jgi:hypothetical protein
MVVANLLALDSHFHGNDVVVSFFVLQYCKT